jgi:hypothetical protein
VLDNTCDLKKVWITVAKYRVEVEGDFHYGTALYAFYKTDSVEALEKYGFAQFIRGCIFESQKGPDGSVRKIRSIDKKQFDATVSFHFPKWVIDSENKDPLYWSYPGKVRLHYYLWSDNGELAIYGRKKPSDPVLFVQDHPSSAFILEGSAHNVSNEFRTCIYKTADVPLETTESDMHFAKPIKCFTWNSIFVYNHDSGIFEEKNELDSFCTMPLEKKN